MGVLFGLFCPAGLPREGRGRDSSGRIYRRNTGTRIGDGAA